MKSLEFGRMLRQGLHLVAGHQGWTIDSAMEKLGASLTRPVGPGTVEGWKAGRQLPSPEQLLAILEFLFSHGLPGRRWLSRFLDKVPEALAAQACVSAELAVVPSAARQALLDKFYPLVDTGRATAHISTLPGREPLFLGRERELAEVLTHLGSDWPAILIVGFAGSGKTTLAVECAWACLAAGTPFTNAVFITPTDRIMTLSEALEIFAQALDIPTVLHGGDLAGRRKQLRNYLAQHPILLVADNLEAMDDALLRFLDDVPGPSKVLATALEFDLLQNAYVIGLKGLAEGEACALIRQYAKAKGLFRLVSADDAVLRPLAAVTAGLPLAIRMALGLVAKRGGGIDAVVTALRGADTSVGALFNRLYGRAWRLLEDSVTARTVLLALPFFAAPATREAIGAVTGIEGEGLDAALSQLTRMSLLEEQGSEGNLDLRWTFHPLTRAFVMKQRWPLAATEVARMRDAWAAYWLEFCGRVLRRPDLPPGYWQALTTRAMVQRVAPDWPNLRAVLAWAEAAERDELLRDLFLSVVHFMDQHFLFADRLHYANSLIVKAAQHGWLEEEIALRIDAMGWCLLQQEEVCAAEREIQAGLALARRSNTPASREFAALGLAFLAQLALGHAPPNLEGAVTLAEEALTVGQSASAIIRRRLFSIEGSVYGERAVRDQRPEDFARASNAYANAIAVRTEYQSDGEPWEPLTLQAFCQLQAGRAHSDEHQLQQAEAGFRVVVDVPEVGGRKEVGWSWYGLGCIAEARGDPAEAIVCFRRAIAVFEVAPTYRPAQQKHIRAHLGQIEREQRSRAVPA